MRFLPFIAALILLAVMGGAVLLATAGSWLLGLMLVAGSAVGALLVLIPALRVLRRPPASPGYVERERVGF